MPDWNARYLDGDTPWDVGEATVQLAQLLVRHELAPCPVLELGCGTGADAVFLAERGFEVSAVDVAEEAVWRAGRRIEAAGVSVNLRCTDMLELSGSVRFPFVFDVGVYHVLRRNDVTGFVAVLADLVDKGGLYWTMAGNPNEAQPEEGGPPTVTAEELCRDLSPAFDLIELRETRFHEAKANRYCPLAWSALWRRSS